MQQIASGIKQSTLQSRFETCQEQWPVARWL